MAVSNSEARKRHELHAPVTVTSGGSAVRVVCPRCQETEARAETAETERDQAIEVARRLANWWVLAQDTVDGKRWWVRGMDSEEATPDQAELVARLTGEETGG